MSFDFCYHDNESKINIKNQHVQYDFKDMLMLQPAESEHGGHGDFTIGRVPTATVLDLQPWVLASLVCPLNRFACRAPARQRGAAATCSRCLRNACGGKAKVPHSRCRLAGLLIKLSMQVTMTVDSEVSLRLRPCVARRLVKQRRLQGMWLQKRRWRRIRAARASKDYQVCKRGTREREVIV